MALSLLTAAFLMSAVRNVSGEQHDLKSITAICKKIQSTATKLNQHFLSCEPGSCPEGGKTVGSCLSDETKIAFKVELDGNTLCTERCVKHGGHHEAGSTGKSHSTGATHTGMKDHSGDAGKKDHSGGHHQPASTSHTHSTKDKDMKDPAPGAGQMKDKEPKKTEALPKGTTADGTDAPVADGGATTSESPAAASGPVAAGVVTKSQSPAAGPEAEMATAPTVAGTAAPPTCKNIAEALMKLPQAAGLAEVATKVLDPASIAILTDPAANLTVFVPPQEALLKVLGGWQSGAIPIADVATILKLHIVPDVLLGADLVTFEGESLPTLAGNEELMVSLEGDKVALMANNTVFVVEDDIEGCTDSQVIHTVDGLLIPEGLELDLAALPDGNLGEVAGLAPAGAAGERDAAPAAQTGGAASMFSAAGILAVAVFAIIG